jgi:hypothetical protein
MEAKTMTELPEPAFFIECNDEPRLPVYTADQLRAFARAYAEEAVKQEREAGVSAAVAAMVVSRDEALEEAATLCVHLAAGLWADDMRFKQAAGANECAGRIRALIGTKPLAALRADQGGESNG